MKRLLFILLTFVSLSVHAAVEIDGIYYSLYSSSRTAKITYGSNEYTGDITIPESITASGITYSVTNIGDFAFDDCSGLTSVTIPNSVTSIGDYAFQDCTGLTSVTIPNSVTSIGEQAFYRCSGLTSVTMGNSVASIGRRAFQDCSGLTSVTIPNSVTSIGNNAFQDCSGLTSVTIGNSVTSIGDDAFQGCSHITTPIIVNKMFVKLPDNFVGHYSIPNGIEQIVGGAFYCCYYLTSITIPESVTSIGDGAFAVCSGLTSVTIPNSVTSIGYGAFNFCYHITTPIIVNKMFVKLPDDFVGHYSIPNGIEQIVGGAFYSCNYLTSITIPESVTSIGNSAFDGCSGLTSVTIPNSVTSIGSCAFWECSGLTSVTIPNSVTSIGWGAFRSCSGLTSVTIGSGVKTIEFSAFNGCVNLKTVTCLAEDVPSVGYGTFDSYVEDAILYVPSESLDDYSAESHWNKFGTIEGIEIQNDPVYELVDGTDISIARGKKYEVLTYTRNFKNTNWQPLYVPFSMSFEDWESQGLEVARINGFYEYDDNLDGKIDRSALEVLKVTATEGDLKPNHPYMVRATTTGEKKITVNNATLYPTEQSTIDCSTVETKYTFTGTYSAIANAELTAMGAYVMGGGALGQSTSNLNPMRWYMVRESRGGQLLPALKSIKVYVYGEDEADAIDFTYDNEAEGEAYNLMGQKVSSSQKGIVIRNGKKFVNK